MSLKSENGRQQYKLIVIFGMVSILLLAFVLRLWRTDAFGIGQSYNSAGAVNMLLSPSNFFFIVADAGGVTIDKTPISLWIQSLSVALLGVSGFALILPSIFATSLSICILYRLVSRDFGHIAGLIAAFVLATTPISIAVDRTNVVDSILILAMLLSTWGILRAIRKSTLSSLMWATALLGIAFNVKMLQAFIAAPALYAAYFFVAKGTWSRKFQQLTIASIVLIMVSSSWLMIVELTPKDQRPYIGSTRHNSAIELVFGYSALFRLLGGNQYYALIGETAPQPNITPTQASPEIGAPSPLRFFHKELGNEMSWLLPFAFWSIILLITRSNWQFPLRKEHCAVILWGLWLVAGMIVLSRLSFLHAFYLATLVPALAALVGIGCVKLWDFIGKSPRLGISFAYLALLSSLACQLLLASYYPVQLSNFFLLAIITVAILLVATSRSWKRIAIIAYLVSLLQIPFIWGLATALERFDANAPAAYEARATDFVVTDLAINFVEGDLSITDIVQRDDKLRYDLVVSNQSLGAPISLLTDLRVMYLGGFSGDDPIYTTEDFARLLEAGEIGYVLKTSQHPEIMAYVAQVCIQVRAVIEPTTDSETGEISGGAILYRCKN